MATITSYEEYEECESKNNIKKIVIHRYMHDKLYYDDIKKFKNLNEIDIETMYITDIDILHYICDNVEKINCIINYNDIIISVEKNNKLKLNNVTTHDNTPLVKLCDNLPINLNVLLVSNAILLHTNLTNLPATLKKLIIFQELEQPYLPILAKIKNIKLPNNCKIMLMTEVYFGIRFNDYYFKNNKPNYNIIITDDKINIETLVDEK